MKILFLGPDNPFLIHAILRLGHRVVRMNERFDCPWLNKEHPDFALSFGYRYLLRPPVIDWFGGRLVNLHISLLPWNRGADPNLWSWVENTPKGISIHRVDEGVDTGDILLQKAIGLVAENHTLKSSYDQLSQALERLCAENLPALLAGEIQPQKQDGEGSYHRSADKSVLLPLLQKQGWDTPVCCLQGVLQQRST